jgi:hypothetical protein
MFERHRGERKRRRPKVLELATRAGIMHDGQEKKFGGQRALTAENRYVFLQASLNYTNFATSCDAYVYIHNTWARRFCLRATTVAAPRPTACKPRAWDSFFFFNRLDRRMFYQNDFLFHSFSFYWHYESFGHESQYTGIGLDWWDNLVDRTGLCESRCVVDSKKIKEKRGGVFDPERGRRMVSQGWIWWASGKR